MISNAAVKRPLFLIAALCAPASAQLAARLAMSAPTPSFIVAAAPAASAAPLAAAPSLTGFAAALTAAPALASFSAAPIAPAAVAAAAASIERPAPAAAVFAAAPATAAPARATAVARALAVSDASLPALSAAAMDGSRAKSAEPAKAPAEPRKMEVLKLRPTQMSVGLREVDEKVDKIKKEGEAYLRARPVPVVLGPNGRVYLIDHHHLVRAAWEAGVAHVHVEIKADLSGLSDDDFWKRMEKEKWVYPYDQLGGGPHDPRNLPETVRGLADDPYRSVAGEVRERGGYAKNDEPFSEFLWAQFFRQHLTAHPVYHDFETAVAEAMTLAKTEAAKHLPGWSGR
jgi:hypothetical protein